MHQEPQVNPSLENMMSACVAAGHPERAYSIIQITGTNGKTSTARIIEHLLLAEGMKTGLYTSPSLVSETERIRVGGEDISEDELAHAREAANKAAASIGLRLTDFEEMTLAMFIHLRDSAVDFAVVEVGMGGKWDATSAANPAVAVITAIGLDHKEFLGDTYEEIADDKSHIIKPGSSVILGQSLYPPHHEVHIAKIFEDRAAGFSLHPRVIDDEAFKIIEASPLHTRFEVRTPHQTYSNLMVAAPDYQASNTATAIFATEAALGRPLNQETVYNTIASMTFPGRFEILRDDPFLMFDGSHNPAAIKILSNLIQELIDTKFNGEKPVIALGILADKDAEGIIKNLAPIATSFITLECPNPRTIPADTLSTLIGRFADVPVVDQDLLNMVLNTTGKQPVIVTGSLSLYPLLQSIRLCVGEDAS